MDREPLVCVDGTGVKLVTGEWFNLTDWKSANQLYSLCLCINAAHEARVKEAEKKAVEEFAGRAVKGLAEFDLSPQLDCDIASMLYCLSTEPEG